MKHKNLSTLVTLYNVVKVGSNLQHRYIDTSSSNYIDESKDFINEVRTYGYDILVPGDFRFSEKESEYNRVMELKAKSENYEEFDKYNFTEICVCGSWIFTEKNYGFQIISEKIKDIRGGKREGSGRKSKYNFLGGTTTMRVPKYEKNDIKRLLDFLIETQVEGTVLTQALSRVLLNAEGYVENCDACGMDMSQDKEYIEVVRKLREAIPVHFSLEKNL